MARQSASTKKNGSSGATTPDAAQEVTVEDLQRQVDTLTEDIAALSSTLVALGAAKKNAAVSAGAERIAAAAERGRNLAAEIEGGFEALGDEARRTVTSRPFASVAIAAALGIAVGFLTARRQ